MGACGCVGSVGVLCVPTYSQLHTSTHSHLYICMGVSALSVIFPPPRARHECEGGCGHGGQPDVVEELVSVQCGPSIASVV